MSNDTTTELSTATTPTTVPDTTDVTDVTDVTNFTDDTNITDVYTSVTEPQTWPWTSESQPHSSTHPEEVTTRVTESTTADSTTTEVAQTTTVQAGEDGSGALSAGAIAGIVVGSIVALLVIVFLCYCCCRRIKRRKETKAQPMKPFRYRMREQLEKALRRFTHYESRAHPPDPDDEDSDPGSPPPTVELANRLACTKETESSVYTAREDNPCNVTPQSESTAEVHHEDVAVDVVEDTAVAKPELQPRVPAAVVAGGAQSEQTTAISEGLPQEAGKPEPDYMNLPAMKSQQSSVPVPSPGYELKDGNDNDVQNTENVDRSKKEPDYVNHAAITGTLERDTRDHEPVDYTPVKEVRGEEGGSVENETVNSNDKAKPIYANVTNVTHGGEHDIGQQNEDFTHEPSLDNSENANDETVTQISASMPNLQGENPAYANLPVARPRLDGRTPSRDRSTLEPNYYNVQDEIQTLPRKC